MTIISEKSSYPWVLWVTHSPKSHCRAMACVFKQLLHHLQKEVLWLFQSLYAFFKDLVLQKLSVGSLQA